jgi:hypothetical protein
LIKASRTCGIAATTEAASVIGCSFSAFSSYLLGSSLTAISVARLASSGG